jgi:hypothetical protein
VRLVPEGWTVHGRVKLVGEPIAQVRSVGSLPVHGTPAAAAAPSWTKVKGWGFGAKSWQLHARLGQHVLCRHDDGPLQRD